MIVVAIIGLLVTVALPSVIKARKQAQGRRVMNDVRQIDAAMEQGALELGYKDGDPAYMHNYCNSRNCSCMWGYLKGHNIGTGNSTPRDVLGYMYVFTVIGTDQVNISTSTKSALAGVGIDWGAY